MFMDDEVKRILLAGGLLGRRVEVSPELLAPGEVDAYELIVEDLPGGRVVELRRKPTPAEVEYEVARDYALSPTDDNWSRLRAARDARIAAERPAPSGGEVSPR